MMLLQMVTGPRRQSLLQHNSLACQTTKNCNDFMMQGRLLLGSQNNKVSGSKQQHTSAMLTLRKDSLPAALHFLPFISSGVPLSRTKGYTTTIFSSCGMRSHCTSKLISQASQLRNGALFWATCIGSRCGQGQTLATQAYLTLTLHGFGSVGDPSFLAKREVDRLHPDVTPHLFYTAVVKFRWTRQTMTTSNKLYSTP